MFGSIRSIDWCPSNGVFFSTYEPTFLNEDVQIMRSNRAGPASLEYSSGASRSHLLDSFIYSKNLTSISDDCSIAFHCRYETECRYRMNETCPETFFMPNIPIAFGHIYFAYRKDFIATSKPHYICYNDRFCDGFYTNRTLMVFNNMTCRKPEDFPLSLGEENQHSPLSFYIARIQDQLHQCNTIIYNDLTVCNNSIMYKCLYSLKCILLEQLCDGNIDCSFKDDEQCSLINDTCEVLDSNILFKCKSTNLCITIRLVNNGLCNCGYTDVGICDDEPKSLQFDFSQVQYSIICNGYTQINPILIDGRNETDETDCGTSLCNNAYTRCDGYWNCLDGIDEINCNFETLSPCPYNHHLCVSPKTYQFMCLPIEQANDGRIDCVGATDEPKLCRSTEYISRENFYCKTDIKHSCILSTKLCSEKHRCISSEDERLCHSIRNITGIDTICEEKYNTIRNGLQTFFCQQKVDVKNTLYTRFSLSDYKYSLTHSIKQLTNTIVKDPPSLFVKNVYGQDCHRGLPLRVWLNSEKNLSKEVCLCPPSFYGKTCQYENERVSLTVQFSAYSNSRRTLFVILTSLIDDESNERQIYSYQQHTYLYLRDCSKKYNINLRYPTRPKYSSTNYSIHIDAYEKLSFVYRGSFRLPIQYPFLPVNRIAVQLTIPSRNKNLHNCFDQSCQHGRCVKYIDNSKSSTSTFCQCKQGWYGKDCSIPHICQCSFDSLCIGVSANNQSVCICSINQWGSRCLLRNNPCQSDKDELCLNGGRCVRIDEQLQRSTIFFCICRKGYHGKICEYMRRNLTLSFHRNIVLPQSMTVHFLELLASRHNPSNNGSLLQSIALYQRSIIIYWSNPFHVVFVELMNNYYLVIVQLQYNESKIYNPTIVPSDRCPHITELNNTLTQLHPFRRMKYYQIQCNRYTHEQLKCFYDDNYFCLCYDYNQQRSSNCFNFQNKTQQICNGLSECENGGRCIQDTTICPQISLCICPKCFHGKLCQFTSHLIGLSLDAILGYHIQPFINLFRQPMIVIISFILTTLITVVGIINGFLSSITFKNKQSQKHGCDLYLIGSSITTLCVILIFVLKFSILLTAQIKYITNNLFLNIQCYSIDFLLRVGLNMNQYMNACVTFDRASTVIKGVHFNQKKSRQVAKYVIVLLLIWIMSTLIHDPIHRRLIYENDDNDDDEEDKRIWCIVGYSSNLRIFDSIINLIHYFVPFLTNLSSALIIIIFTARQRLKRQQHQTYRKILQEQCREHKHLLVAPITLVILALPRLILSFKSDCMAANGNPWLPLMGYFISTIPPIITLVIFVFPSKLYMKQYRQSIRQIQNAITLPVRQRLGLE